MQVLAYTGNDDARKFLLDGEIAIDNIKVNYIPSSNFLETRGTNSN